MCSGVLLTLPAGMNRAGACLASRVAIRARGNLGWPLVLVPVVCRSWCLRLLCSGPCEQGLGASPLSSCPVRLEWHFCEGPKE